ncbi:hypothetical protein LHJ74_19270 [Streptomyces sp. N2-109]|uniref:Uncharacterized protein n=1 Tax=Streptomyces gossypii TaxID=2883101 RepID=A0ABT2JWA4_9ACTN|nr:hypothetical protein [Streptomyces gossypii]MCT2592016.1 hypothetical protein [Streptomyces gossypii]
MTTALAVTSHGHMLSPPDRHTPRAHLLKPPGEQPLEAALDEIHTLLEQHGYLIALYPDSLPTPFLHRLHTLRALLESDRIALLPTGLPPLATGVLVRQLRQLSLCDFSPGVLAAAARLLAHYIHAGAVLNSVAKLDRIPVSLTAHAKSWMPGAQFAVLAVPTPRLIRLGSGGESGGSAGGGLPAPEYGTRLTVAAGAVGSDWVTQTLAQQWGAAEVQEAYLPDDSARWWGTAKLTEFAAAIPDASVLYQLVASVRRDECHWCGLELIGDRCAFCSAPVPPGPSPAHPAPPRAATRRPGHVPTPMAAPPVAPVPEPMPQRPAAQPPAPPQPPSALAPPTPTATVRPLSAQPPAQPRPSGQAPAAPDAAVQPPSAQAGPAGDRAVRARPATPPSGLARSAADAEDAPGAQASSFRPPAAVSRLGDTPAAQAPAEPGPSGQAPAPLGAPVRAGSAGDRDVQAPPSGLAPGAAARPLPALGTPPGAGAQPHHPQGPAAQRPAQGRSQPLPQERHVPRPGPQGPSYPGPQGPPYPPNTAVVVHQGDPRP